MLYIATGDGGGGGDPFRNGQNRRSLLGKILRIEPAPPAARAPAVYSYGLRNPFRFSFDRSTGDIAIGDVGQDEVEEIDFLRRGPGPRGELRLEHLRGHAPVPLGQRARARPPGDPAHATTTAGARSSAASLFETGRTTCSGATSTATTAWRASTRPGSAAVGASDVRRVGVRVNGLSSFGEDARGRVYATSLNGPVYRLR